MSKPDFIDCKRLVDNFFTALSFLTKIPIQGKLSSFSESFVFFPLVGLIIGGLISFILYAFRNLFPSNLLGYIGVAFDAWITRGLHYDGFADWIDALGGGYTVERRLAILKDSNVGAFAVIGLIICIALKATAFSHLVENGLWYPIILAPAFGRFSMVALSPGMPSARSGEGLGGSFIAGFETKTLWFAFLTMVPCFFLNPVFFGIMLICSIFLIFGSRWIHRKYFGGLTGDLYGATCQLTEVFLLVVATGIRVS